MKKNRSVTTMDDLELAKHAAEHEQAFEELHRRHSKKTHQLCMRMLKHHHEADAEELNQEAWANVFRKIKDFRGDSKFSSWLHRVTTNQVLDHLRKKRSRPEVTAAEMAGAEEAEGTPRDVSCSCFSEMQAATQIDLAQACAKLRHYEHMVFVLFTIEGHSHPEIAKMLGIKLWQSKEYIHRAHKKLREELERKH